MTAPDLIAVFDVGKTNAKLIVADPQSGEALWSATRPTLAGAQTPYRSLDVHALGAFLMESLSNAPARERIGTIVPVAHGACAVLMTGDDLALPVLDYEESALEEIASAYAAERDPFTETFSPHLPFGLNLGRQLAFLEARHPEAFGRADRILPYPQYWAHLLSGVAASEVTSLGSHTDLWRPLEKTWSSLALRRGWTRLFPDIRPAHAPLGPLKPDIAQRAGLRSDLQVLCGVHDSNASFLRHLAARDPAEPFAVVSTGTWIIVMANGAALESLDESRDMLANVNVHGAPLPTARIMGGREYEAIAGAAPVTRPAPSDLEEALAAEAFAWPSFSLAGGPFQGRAGRLENADALAPAARAALATLYLALVTEHMLVLLRAKGDVVVEGPMASNPLFGPLLAGLGRSVSCSSDRSGTLGGALALAGFGGRGKASEPCPPLWSPRLEAHRRRWMSGL